MTHISATDNTTRIHTLRGFGTHQPLFGISSLMNLRESKRIAIRLAKANISSDKKRPAELPVIDEYVVDIEMADQIIYSRI